MLQRVTYGALAATLWFGVACGDDDDDITPPVVENNFTANLTGAAELPNPVTTTASGVADIVIDESAGTITFTITVTNLTDAIDAHIHVGAVTVVGPAVVDLLPEAQVAGTVSGQLSTGVITAAQITGAETFATLVAKIRTGDAYVNVHTLANPDGEIRGQLVPD